MVLCIRLDTWRGLFIYHLFTHLKFDMEMPFRVSERSFNWFINQLSNAVMGLETQCQPFLHKLKK